MKMFQYIYCEYYVQIKEYCEHFTQYIQQIWGDLSHIGQNRNVKRENFSPALTREILKIARIYIGL